MFSLLKQVDLGHNSNNKHSSKEDFDQGSLPLVIYIYNLYSVGFPRAKIAQKKQTTALAI